MTTPATLYIITGDNQVLLMLPGNVPDSIIRIVSVKDAPPIEHGLYCFIKRRRYSVLIEINYTIASYSVMMKYNESSFRNTISTM